MNRIHPRGVGRKYDIIGKRNSSKLETASGDIDVFSTPIEVPYQCPIDGSVKSTVLPE